MSPPLPSWLMFTPGELASLGIGFIPVVGTALSVFEVATGRDIITGEEVHRGVALIGVVPGGKAIRAVVSRGILTKPTATNPALHRTIDELFKSKDKIAGGTAGAVRHERATGNLVRGKVHSAKADERIKNLRNIIQNQRLTPEDRATAIRLIEDLEDALQTPRVHP